MPARILVVEDNADNLKLMTYLLRAFGHEVMTAGDGVEALDIARREALDLIVCDIQLPRLDGYGVAGQVKAHPALKGIPLVAVTALAMVGDRDKVLAAGFDGYIPKPIVPRTFIQQVEAFLKPHLPAPPPVPAGPAPQPPEPGSHRGTVLVVDNSFVNLELAKKTLEPFGYQVRAAHGVEEALALARQDRPDLIVSDLHMPKLNGYDLIKAVKADPVLATIPFVFLSSTVWHDSDREHGLALGALKFLQRPMEPKKLLAEIEGCLGQRKTEPCTRS